MNQDRRNKIAQMVAQNQTVKNAELMELFDISIETVRRDLAYLEQQGVLERVYGGAVKKTFLNAEPTFQDRETSHHAEKWAIAREAEKLIQSNDTVFFDLGTTVQYLAQQLGDKKIMAFTNALRTAIVLSEQKQDVIIPGGRLRPQELAISGPMAQSNMTQFNIDKAVIGVAGITEDGITDFKIEEAALRSQVIRNARQVIVLADHSKFGTRTAFKVCDIRDIDILVTDSQTPEEFLHWLEDAGVQVIIAHIE